MEKECVTKSSRIACVGSLLDYAGIVIFVSRHMARAQSLGQDLAFFCVCCGDGVITVVRSFRSFSRQQMVL